MGPLRAKTVTIITPTPSPPPTPTPAPTTTPSLLWNLYAGPIRRDCGGIPCDHGPPNAQVAIRRVYVARGSMGPWRCKMYNIVFVCACGAVCKMTYPATYQAYIYIYSFFLLVFPTYPATYPAYMYIYI